MTSAPDMAAIEASRLKDECRALRLASAQAMKDEILGRIIDKYITHFLPMALLGNDHAASILAALESVKTNVEQLTPEMILQPHGTENP